MAEPRTIQGDVNGTGVVSYTLPPGVFQYVQSIRVEIDNTGGGDARPKLDIAEQAGAVIATKRQGEAIPAGDTGSATWALRLTDEQAAAAGGGDYVLVADVAPFGGAFSFPTVPSDARHLVIFLDFWFASQFPVLTFNGDTNAGHYRTLRETIEDVNGVVTNTIVSPGFGVENGIPLYAMGGEKPNRAVITIPYSRFLRPFSDFDRSVYIESWARTENAVSGLSSVGHTKQTGWWQAATPAASVIQSISLSIAGGDGRASLYKVL